MSAYDWTDVIEAEAVSNGAEADEAHNVIAIGEAMLLLSDAPRALRHVAEHRRIKWILSCSNCNAICILGCIDCSCCARRERKKTAAVCPHYRAISAREFLLQYIEFGGP